MKYFYGILCWVTALATYLIGCLVLPYAGGTWWLFPLLFMFAFMCYGLFMTGINVMTKDSWKDSL